MDAALRTKAERLAGEMAGQAETIEDLNNLMRLMMKSGLERMLQDHALQRHQRVPGTRERKRVAARDQARGDLLPKS